MAVKRNKDGSININNKNGVFAVARIVFSPDSNDEIREKYRAWVEECANNIKACAHTIEETEQFFLQQCKAIPIDKDDLRMKNYQYSLVMNYLHTKSNYQFSDFPFDGTDEKIENWDKEQRDIRREIRNTSQEHYGFKMSGYYLPKTERNLYLYEEFKKEIKDITKQRENDNLHGTWKEIEFFFEKTTENIQCSNGGRSLINRLIIFRGVGEEDIKLRNNRFQGYLSSMRELGYLPDFRMN